ncbi:MAG TPA: YbdK family carboxylate-amine ligase, partial [Solirubrobacteraceae bacterium]|nr:YbdK family carboxylate-amine ligase [Solirubrobacteraceae bacterium]
MEHNFTGPSFTIGIEEELMICDGETFSLVNAIESLLQDGDAQVKPELMESVLEIATNPLANTAAAGAELRALRREVRERAASRGLTIGAAGTHPFAMWEDQRIVARSRYRDIISALRFVARQEIIFGLHVHVGLEGPDRAIHVANGLRVHLPVLLALSANSPFWRADATGLQSTRTPVFRAFPRVGIPPAYRDWEHYSSEIEFMVSSGVMEDYTYLWYDVRPHPNLGTVEVRVCDVQTRVEHTLGLAALIQAMVKELAEHFDAGGRLSD